MAMYRISGVWIDSKNEITHYALHKVEEEGTSRAKKTTKSEAISLLETRGNSAKTWIWDYKQSKWTTGQDVEVVNGRDGKYLRSDPNNTQTDNLRHLIDFDWITG